MATPSDAYHGLRDLALRSSRTELGLPATSTPTTPWAAMMDWGVAQGTATIVAIADGHASVYLSGGGGFVGGGQSHESVRNAAKRMVTAAIECQPQLHPTNSYPLPQRGEVTFYVLTDAGIFTGSASEEEMSGHRHSLSKLGDAAQAIITQYRLIESSSSSKTAVDRANPK